MLCLIMTLAMTNISFAEQASQYLLEIPEDATVVVINEDNFDDFFENSKVVFEREQELAYVNDSVYGTSANNVLCRAELPQYIDFYKFFNYSNEGFTAYAIYYQSLEYWAIKLNAGYGMNSIVYSALYDDINKTLYIFDSFYIRISRTDSAEITKLEQLSFGMVENFKITFISADFKKLPYVTVTYNGEMIMFDQKPVIEEGRTLVPLRAIFEKLGAEIDWNGETSTVTATKDGTTISLTINNTTATKNGEAISLDVPAKIINGRTLVPVRFISDCFGVNVEWDGNARRVILTK